MRLLQSGRSVVVSVLRLSDARCLGGGWGGCPPLLETRTFWMATKLGRGEHLCETPWIASRCRYRGPPLGPAWWLCPVGCCCWRCCRCCCRCHWCRRLC